MNQLKLLVLFLLVSSAAFATAPQRNNEKLQGTALLASQLVGGSAALFTHQEIIVTDVKKSGNTTYITLKTTDQKSTATIKVPTLLPGQLSLAAGQVVKVTSNAGGYVLYAAGQLIAVLPHEFNKTLTLKANA